MLDKLNAFKWEDVVTKPHTWSNNKSRLNATNLNTLTDGIKNNTNALNGLGPVLAELIVDYNKNIYGENFDEGINKELHDLINSIGDTENIVNYKGVLVDVPSNLDDFNVGDIFLVGTNSYIIIKEGENKKVQPLGIDFSSAIEGLHSDLDDKITALDVRVKKLEYVPIEISSFTLTPASSEIGSTVKKVTLEWELNKQPEDISAISIEYMSGDKTIEEDVQTDATEKILEGLSISSNTSFKLCVKDENDILREKSTSLTFYNKCYYGVPKYPYDINNISTFFSGLESSTQSKFTPFTVTANEGQYIYYCVPDSVGDCTFTVNGFTGGFTLINTVDFTNSSGHTEPYRIYRSDEPNLGTTTVNVN